MGSHELDQCLLSLFPNTAGGLCGGGGVQSAGAGKFQSGTMSST